MIDLLNNSHRRYLSVRWSKNKGFYVENLFTVECETLDDLMAVLEEGRCSSHACALRSVFWLFVLCGLDFCLSVVPDRACVCVCVCVCGVCVCVCYMWSMSCVCRLCSPDYVYRLCGPERVCVYVCVVCVVQIMCIYVSFAWSRACVCVCVVCVVHIVCMSSVWSR